MTDNKTQAIYKKIIQPQARTGLVIVGVIILLFAVAIAVFMAASDDTQETAVATPGVDNSRSPTTANINPSKHFKKAIKSENKQRYEQAIKQEGGVSMPLVFDEPMDDGLNKSTGEIQACVSCTPSDEQLIMALKRLGYSKTNNSGASDLIQVGTSDIYLDTNGMMTDQMGKPHQFDGKNIFVDSESRIADEQSQIIVINDNPVFLGDSGGLFFETSDVPLLAGRLMSSENIVIMPDGHYVYRKGNMTQQGQSDVYVSTEHQLVTLDGRPILSSGEPVFKNTSSALINRRNEQIIWENQGVFQNNQGYLQNISNETFVKNGILFSYSGILIDNLGMLTQALVSVTRLGNSDIYINAANQLSDAYGDPLRYEGAAIRMNQADRALVTEFGLEISNRGGAKITITELGALTTNEKIGSVFTGIIKADGGEAYSRSGLLLSNSNELTQRGQSDIYVTSDGFISDSKGFGLKFETSDVYLNLSRLSRNGGHAIETYTRSSVRTKAGGQVYLSPTGVFTDVNGVKITEIGVLTTLEGVMMTPDGKAIVVDTSLMLVTTANGDAVNYNDMPVYRDKNNQLFDAQGNPILSEDGAALYMDDNGIIKDSNGRLVSELPFTVGQYSIAQGEAATRTQLKTDDGQAILFGDKETYLDHLNRLVDEDGNLILSEDGKTMTVNAQGELVDSEGNKIANGGLRTASGRNVNAGIIKGAKQVVTKSGAIATYQGKKVFVSRDGSLVDSSNQPILSSTGSKLYLDANGNIVDRSGRQVKEGLLKAAGKAKLKQGQATVRTQLTSSNGAKLQYKGKDVFLDQRTGQLFDSNGKAIKSDTGQNVFFKGGKVVNAAGHAISDVELTEQYQAQADIKKVDSAELLTDASGRAVLYNNKKVYVGADGRLKDEAGNLIKSSDGRDLYMNASGDIVDSANRKVNEALFSDATGNTITSGFKKGRKILLDSNGAVVKHNNKTVYVRPDGVLEYESGETVTDAEGNLVRAQGGELVAKRILSEHKELVGSDGKALTFNGRTVYQNDKGQVFDEFGKAILSDDGREIFINAAGETVDATGNLITEHNLVDSSGIKAISGIKQGKTVLVTESGAISTKDGKRLYVGKNGNLEYTDGSVVTDRYGNALTKEAYQSSPVDSLSKSNWTVTKQRAASMEQPDLTKTSMKRVLTDAYGGEVTFNNKKVFLDDQGQAFDEHGAAILDANGNKVFVNDKGELVDQFNQLIKDDLLKDSNGKSIRNGLKAERSILTNEAGQAIQYDGRDVYVDDKGYLTFKNGDAVLDASGKRVKRVGNAIVNDDGQAVSADKWVTQSNSTRVEKSINPSKVGEARLVTDANGKAVLYKGKNVYKDSQGRLFDEMGNRILSSSGEQAYINAQGELVDEHNNIIEEGLLTNSNGKTMHNGFKAGRKILTDESGNIVKHNGKTVYVGDGGVLEYADRSLIKGTNGKALFSQGGRIVDANGRLTSDRGFTSAQKTKVISKALGDGPVKTQKLLTTASGDPLLFNNKKVYKNAKGQLVDEHGVLVKSKDGKTVFMNAAGQLVDASGAAIKEPILTLQNGTIYKGKVHAKKNVLTDANGRIIKYNGKDVVLNDDGTLEYLDGSKVRSGDKLVSFKNGQFIDAEGHQINDDGFTVEAIVNDNPFQTMKELIGVDGKPVTLNGKKLFTRDDGAIIDADGKVVTSKSGKDLYYKDGKITDMNGIAQSDHGFKSIESSAIVNRGIKTGKLLQDKNGGALLYNNKRVYSDENGNIFDEFGNQVKTSDGRAVKLSKDGLLVDSNGHRIKESILTDSAGNAVSSGVVKGADLVIDDSGKAIKHNGALVFKDKSGNLVDYNNNLLKSADGKSLKLVRGSIVDSNGRRVDTKGFTVEGEKAANRLTTREQLTNKNGEAITFNGEAVYRAANGMLITESGKPVLDESGSTVFMDQNSNLINRHGKPSASVNLMSNSGAVMPGDLVVKSNANDNVVRIGDSDILVARDGTLLDKSGGAILFNGKKVKVRAADGVLVDEDGIPIRDRSGREVLLTASGKLVHKDGSAVTDELLTDSNNVLLNGDGKLVSRDLVRIGNSDLYKTSSGKLVDAQGREVKYNNETVYVSEDGSLKTVSGRPVKDKSGGRVYLNPGTGQMVNKKGEPAEGVYLVSGSGALIDASGELLTSGGKLMKIPGTNLYQTSDGLVVTKDGKPTTFNGENIYIDENNKLVNFRGKAIKYQQSELIIDSEDGTIRNTAGTIAVMNNGSPLTFDKDGELVTNTVANTNNAAVSNRTSLANPSSSSSRSVTAQGTASRPTPETAGNNVEIPPVPSFMSSMEMKPEAAESIKRQAQTRNPMTNRQGTIIDTSNVSSQQLLALLDQRYKKVHANVASEFAMAVSSTLPDPSWENVTVVNKSEAGKKPNGQPSSNEASSKGSSSKADAGKEMLLSLHDQLYVVTNFKVNSDYDNRVTATVIGGVPTNHPLYEAEVHGTFKVAYDNLVLSYNRICLKQGGCTTMDSIAIDPSSNEAGIASDIDTHFWYRYGGLFMSSLLAGASEAVSESATKTETVTPTGTKSTTSGLDGDKLLIRGAGAIGETFVPLFAERFNRPPTIKIEENTEMLLKLFNDITI